MKQLFYLIFLSFSLHLLGQQDTIVVTDYTKVMVSTNDNGEIIPVTSLNDIGKAGFFITKPPEGQLRICHPQDLFVWVDGRLLDNFSNCNLYNPEELFDLSKSDTIFISFSSKSNLSGLSCDLVIFEKLLVIKEEASRPRDIGSSFEDFSITTILILVFFLGFLVSSYPNRIAYIKERSFTFKVSAYEFVNTGFFSPPSINLLAFYSLSMGFVAIYLDILLDINWFNDSENFLGLNWNWIKTSLFIFLIFMMKWVLVSLVAQLFKFNALKNFQMFDFLNFNVVILIFLLLFLLVDFIFNVTFNSWVSNGVLFVFPIGIILFVLWFTLKFVNNSPRKKLVIISYLCATEIIPVIILLGFFYK